MKAFETKEAIQNGADEIDMVINVGALKSGNLSLVESDIRAVVEASGDKLVKVIIEACLLTDQEKSCGLPIWLKKLELILLKHLLAFQLVALR